MNALLDELSWRGMIADSTDKEALAAHLDSGSIHHYVGFDPTAASLHIGHLVQLMVMRRFQEAGHHPILLVGGATGLIGDPKQSGERVMNPAETVAEWTQSLANQMSRYLDFDGSNAARVVNNYDWASKMNVLDFLRDIGKHFSVNRMLARDIVARRLESGISFTEFSYVLLQSLDYLELHQRYGVTLQTGAQDQWGNITAGADLIRRVHKSSVHGLVTPLLTKSDGTKFGKTESGTVWVDPELTSAYAFHQFWLNTEDSNVIGMLKIFTDRSKDEISQLEYQTQTAPHERAAQKALADDVTDLVHGAKDRQAAVMAAAAIFGRAELAALDERTLSGVMKEIGAQTLTSQDAKLPSVVDALTASGVSESKSAARRVIKEGGAYVNNKKITDIDAYLDETDLLAGRFVLLRRGKKKVGGVEILN